jgi:hypothetical protein
MNPGEKGDRELPAYQCLAAIIHGSSLLLSPPLSTNHTIHIALFHFLHTFSTIERVEGTEVRKGHTSNQ